MAASTPFGYVDAVRALRRALTFGINPSLEPIRAMAAELGRPQDAFASVQVTGTNGKSSVTRLIAALFEAHNVCAGAYTSPELHSYTERIACGGVPVSEVMFTAAVGEALDAATRAGVTPTEFEIVTAACLWAFRECGVEAAVLEVGMGGRWDATSVVEPTVAVITGVGLDHTAHLGETREAIAADKAHIIREHSVAVLGPGTVGVEVAFHERVSAIGTTALVRAVRPAGAVSPVAEADTVRYTVTTTPEAPDGATRVDVAGIFAAYTGVEVRAPAYQAANVATAIAAAEAFLERALDAHTVRRAVATITFPGRFQVLGRDPWLVVDAAHNPEGATVLARAIAAAWPDPVRRPTIVLGVLADKDAIGIVAALAPVAMRFVCVAPESSRALPAADLAAVVERVTGTRPEVAESVAAGVEAALAGSQAGAVVTGSIRTVAAATAVAGR
ncbi:MAG: bifunctional folylpolyglutamate synthase/dihydrofolate synthase [Coriobacteriia bacterium]|nr:bifunctional folylpolyglutamate synthase/dihydrofolate synthase [Coriobacteriia bacterium]